MGKAIFKFNGGRGALLCSNCAKIVKTGKEFTEQEWAAMRGETEIKSIYCEDCKDKVVDIDEVISKSTNLGALKDILPMLMQNPEFKESLIEIVSEKMVKNINDITDGKQ